MISREVKDISRKVINCFENGRVAPNYTSIYIYADGPGNRRQITLGFGITEYGNLKRLVSLYIAKQGIYDDYFVPYLPKIGKTPLVDNASFKALLIKAAKEDPLMRQAEDEVFEEKYFEPALKFFNDNGFKQPLSFLVILDSYIHSGSVPSFLRNRFPAHVPTAGGLETEWIRQYVNVRHSWLATHSRTILRGTIYRTNFFKDQINKNNWSLKLPLYPNGVKIAA